MHSRDPIQYRVPDAFRRKPLLRDRERPGILLLDEFPNTIGSHIQIVYLLASLHLVFLPSFSFIAGNALNPCSEPRKDQVREYHI
jgi:hypothetical protein